MRFLLVSDIYNNVVAVRKLRKQETNRFDAVVVAGDIGSEFAPEILDGLSSFGCPVLYVFGNWDLSLGYGQDFGANCQNLHLAPFQCGPLVFVGFSGCPTNWGRNPIAERLFQEIDERNAKAIEAVASAEAAFKCRKAEAEQEFKAQLTELTGGRKRPPACAKVNALERARDKRIAECWVSVDKFLKGSAYQSYLDERAVVHKQVLVANRSALAERVRTGKSSAGRTIVVTHERLHRTNSDMPGILLFVHGHRHIFSDTAAMGVRVVNAASLDRRLLVETRGKELRGWDRFRNVNIGNYAVAEWSEAAGVAVTCRILDRHSWEPEWQIEEHLIMHSAPFLD